MNNIPVGIRYFILSNEISGIKAMVNWVESFSASKPPFSDDLKDLSENQIEILSSNTSNLLLFEHDLKLANLKKPSMNSSYVINAGTLYQVGVIHIERTWTMPQHLLLSTLITLGDFVYKREFHPELIPCNENHDYIITKEKMLKQTGYVRYHHYYSPGNIFAEKVL